jgi:hypothetical protein
MNRALQLCFVESSAAQRQDRTSAQAQSRKSQDCVSEGAVARNAAGAMVKPELCDDAGPWPGIKLACDWFIDQVSDDFGTQAGGAEHNGSPFAEPRAAAMLKIGTAVIVW